MRFERFLHFHKAHLSSFGNEWKEKSAENSGFLAQMKHFFPISKTRMIYRRCTSTDAFLPSVKKLQTPSIITRVMTGQLVPGEMKVLLPGTVETRFKTARFSASGRGCVL